MPSLIWKEWHEQSWKLGFSCVVLGALALIGLRARILADETMLMYVCFLGFTLVPVLSSTGLVPAERADGSLESLLALPVSPRRILLAKTLVGLLLCIGPMAAAAAVSLLMAGGRELTSAAIIEFFARSTLVSVALFIWMLALTIHLPNETRAGLIALGVLVFWLIELIGAEYSYWAMILSPLGFIPILSGPDIVVPPFWGVVACQAIFVVVLWAWAVRQFASLEG